MMHQSAQQNVKDVQLTRPFLALVFGVCTVVAVFSIYASLDADSGIIDPNADGTVAATQVSCGGGGNYDCLDDGVATSATPTTGSDYLDFVLADADTYQMESFGGVATATEVRVHLYHESQTVNQRFEVSLWDETESVQYGSTQMLPVRTSAQWDTATVTGLTLTRSEFDDLRVRLDCTRASDGTTEECRAFSLYADVTYDPATTTQDFRVQRGAATISGTSLTLSAGSDYVAPSSSSSAFIRITNTLNTGAGAATTGDAKDATVRISDPWDIEESVTLERPSTASSTTRVAWEIIEYIGAPGGDNEMIVRQQSTIGYASGALTATTAPAASVADDAAIALFITGVRNPDTATNYQRSNSTSAWNADADSATFTRGESGNTADLSYAIVEFVGDNWKVQRSEHTYTAASSTETESITPVNSLSRAFLHTQKRMGAGLNTHGDFGHQVWLSGIGQISYFLDGSANSPSDHHSVAWVIENTQSTGDTMLVTRSNGTQSGSAAPAAVHVDIGATIDEMTAASIFMNNSGDAAGTSSEQNTFPEPLMAARIISNSQYELWIADTDDSRSWRTEIVEWPTAERSITQNYYRFYVDNDALDPTDPWPAGATDLGENTEVTELDQPIAKGETMRIRMTLKISSAAMAAGTDSFRLQYGERNSTCDAISDENWSDVAPTGSSTALWRGFDATPEDGTALSGDPPSSGDLNISVSDVAGTYEEENDSAPTPYEVEPGEDIEFDWVVQHNDAAEKTSYCFRMIEADGTLFDAYNFYPTMRTAGYTPTLSQWRFYDDETSETPGTALATENTAPTDIAFDNIIKLRTTVAELTGGEGTDIKFKLQYSESSDFSSGVHDVVASSTCAAEATTTANLWCYADGAGIDNSTIDAAVLSDAGACSGGSGAGCGTHNEGTSTTTASYDQPAYSTAEYEFTLRHDGARANAVYYFRLFDLTNATTVPASTSNPSVVTEGAGLTFTVGGVASGTASEGVVADVDTTPTSIPFGSVPLDAELEAIYRLNVDTNATEGYQMFMYARQPLLNSYGEKLPFVSGSNATPLGWANGCAVEAAGCFGYHTGDDVLSDGSTRFAADDTYAALSTSTPEEIMHSTTPTDDTVDIVYKIQITDQQPAGDYQTEIVYLAVPVF